MKILKSLGIQPSHERFMNQAKAQNRIVNFLVREAVALPVAIPNQPQAYLSLLFWKYSQKYNSEWVGK